MKRIVIFVVIIFAILTVLLISKGIRVRNDIHTDIDTNAISLQEKVSKSISQINKEVIIGTLLHFRL